MNKSILANLMGLTMFEMFGRKWNNHISGGKLIEWCPFVSVLISNSVIFHQLDVMRFYHIKYIDINHWRKCQRNWRLYI